jgi:hypothetical protein
VAGKAVVAPKAGCMVRFGAYDWQVLDVQESRALIITKDIVEKRVYHKETKAVTWAECDLRTYLNEEWYHQFCGEEQARIVETDNQNAPNQWFKTDGGSKTRDNIFLLSLDEVIKYFGNSGQLEYKNPSNKYWIKDEYNHARQSKLNNAYKWWWLRSPGLWPNCAVFVFGIGSIAVSGHRIYNDGGGVRPALWLDLRL